jgi:hypothetical protein
MEEDALAILGGRKEIEERRNQTAAVLRRISWEKRKPLDDVLHHPHRNGVSEF